MNSRNRLRQFSDELRWPAAINGICWHNCIGWQDRIVKNLGIVVNLDPMTYDAILANLYVVSDLLGANDTVFVDVNIVTNDHLGVSQTALLLYVTRSNDTLFTDNRVDAHRDLCEVTSQHGARLYDCLAIDEDLFGTLDKHLTTDLVSLGCDEEPFRIVEKGMLLNHHF